MSCNKQRIDLIMGKTNEEKVLYYLNKHYDDKFNFCKYKYSTFDFESSSIIGELKSRRNSYNKYPSTMVGYNKIQKAIEDNTKKYIFYFLFTDGLYSWEFNNDEYNIKVGGRCDRNKPEFKNYAFINIEFLKLITNEIKNIN